MHNVTVNMTNELSTCASSFYERQNIFLCLQKFLFKKLFPLLCVRARVVCHSLLRETIIWGKKKWIRQRENKSSRLHVSIQRNFSFDKPETWNFLFSLQSFIFCPSNFSEKKFKCILNNAAHSPLEYYECTCQFTFARRDFASVWITIDFASAHKCLKNKFSSPFHVFSIAAMSL